MRYWISGIVIVAGGLLAWPALAQPPEEGRERPERGRGSELRERVREEFDKDGDGRLNDEERDAAREAMRDRRARDDADNPPPREERRRDSDRGPAGRRGPDGPAGDRSPEARRRPGPPDGERDSEGRSPEGRRRPGGPDGDRGPEGRGPEARGPVGRRGPESAAGRRSNRNIEALFVWFDNDGDDMLSRGEFGELSQFLRRRPGPQPGALAGSPRGPRIDRRGPDGPPRGDGFGRGRGDGPPGPPRDREFGRRGRGPDGPPRGDRPVRRDGERRERGDREDRGPRADGAADQPSEILEEAV